MRKKKAFKNDSEVKLIGYMVGVEVLCPFVAVICHHLQSTDI